jgi:hypothetical protein
MRSTASRQVGVEGTVLETLRAEARAPSELHLWPEHFDFYVAPWTKPAPAAGWNAVGFTGAEAPRTDEAAALAFFRERRDAS